MLHADNTSLLFISQKIKELLSQVHNEMIKVKVHTLLNEVMPNLCTLKPLTAL